jgi:hypothetical protein
MNNSQQQILQHGSSQGQVQQMSLDMLRPTPGQITLYPLTQVPQVQQVQQVQQMQPSPIMDNQMYVNDTSNISTQDHIYQRLEALMTEIENKDYYQIHCEELNSYLHNENAYSQNCQAHLFSCLKVRTKFIVSLDYYVAHCANYGSRKRE